MAMELVGWFSAICFAVCALPQAIKCWRTKRADDLSVSFLVLWFLGEGAGLVYMWPKAIWPVIFNYTANLTLIGVIMAYKFKPRRGA